MKSKGSGNRVVSYDKSDLDDLLLIGSKGSDGVVGDDKSYFDNCGNSVMNDIEIVNYYILSRRISVRDLTGVKALVSRAAAKQEVVPALEKD